MKTKTLKTTLAALLALACALGCGTTALAAEEWGVIPDDYVLSVPSPAPTFQVEQERPPIATIKIVDTHLDGSFPSCLCPKNLKAIKASCVFGASAAEKAPRPAVCRQF